MVERKRKNSKIHIADKFSFKVSIFKLKLSTMNFRILPFSFYHIVELEKIFPAICKILFVALIVNRFRDNRRKQTHVASFKHCKFELRGAPPMRASLNSFIDGIRRSLCQWEIDHS